MRMRDRTRVKAALVSGRMVPGTTYSIPALAEQFGVMGMPSSVFVDREGRVRHVHRGYKPGDEIAIALGQGKNIQTVLAQDERRVAPPLTISHEQVDEAVATLKKALDQVG
mgnify:CR=1 FL=1